MHGTVGMRRVADAALGSSRRAFVESRSRSRTAMDRSMTYRSSPLALALRIAQAGVRLDDRLSLWKGDRGGVRSNDAATGVTVPMLYV